MRGTRRSKVDPEQATDPRAVRTAAVALLARRDFPSSELRQKLEAEGYDAGLAAEAVAELARGGIVNDARFAENYVAYHADRGQGPLRIAAELKSLGLTTEIVEAALASGPDWRARAREARIRKFGLEPPANWTQKARQARFLQYRGFSSDHIRAAVGPDFDPDESL